MQFNIPLSTSKAAQLISLLDLPPNGKVLDVGCGEGTFLIQLLESSNLHGLGLDLDQDLISIASENAAKRLPAQNHTFRTADIQKENFAKDAFDLAICLGSTHAFGLGDTAYPSTLKHLKQWVKPNGLLLIGEGYWQQPPNEAYLQFLGEPIGIYRDHAANISFAEAYKLTPIYATTSNLDEWDHFEWAHIMPHEISARKNPQDKELASRVEQKRAWRNAYLQWGRATMGFGFYLFMNS